MTNMTIKEQMLKAVDSGISKWNRIRNGQVSFDAGQEWCELCHLYYNKKQSEQNRCNTCPLSQAGHSCLCQPSYNAEISTTWERYNLLVDSIEIQQEAGKIGADQDVFESSLEFEGHVSTLKELIDQIISHLKEAREWVVKNVGDEETE